MKNRIRIIFVLAIMGTLFAGYLTLSKIFTGTCALDTSCPYFLGYPACLYGLVMYLTILVSSLLIILKKFDKKKLMNVIKGVSFAGILFSLYFSVQDLFYCPGCTFSLILPTCVYGLLMYIAIFVLSLKK